MHLTTRGVVERLEQRCQPVSQPTTTVVGMASPFFTSCVQSLVVVLFFLFFCFLYWTLTVKGALEHKGI
jgi:hypothetical protein